jgi:hypothetical protein
MDWGSGCASSGLFFPLSFTSRIGGAKVSGTWSPVIRQQSQHQHLAFRQVINPYVRIARTLP